MDASDNGPAWASFHGYTGLRHTPERAERPECEGPQKMPGTEVGQARHRRIAPPSGSGVGLVGQDRHGTGKDQPNGQQMAGLSTLGGGMPITAGTTTPIRGVACEQAMRLRLIVPVDCLHRDFRSAPLPASLASAVPRSSAGPQDDLPLGEVHFSAPCTRLNPLRC